METGTVVAVVAEIPLQDKIPIAFDGVGEGPRGIGWRADAPATLYWAEAQDGGDPNTEAAIRDCLFTLPAPFTAAPRRLASLAWRYNGVVWGSDAVALVSERRYKTRSARSYLIAPGEDPDLRKTPGLAANVSGSASQRASATSEQGLVSPPDQDRDASTPSARGPCCARACDLSQGEAPRRLVIDIPNWEDRYNDPGSVCTTRNGSGKAVLRLIHMSRGGKDERGRSERSPPPLDRPFFLMQGPGASDDGDRPFLGLFDTISGHETRIWQSSPPMYESVVTILDEDERTGMAKKILLRRETPKDNPNFFVFDLDYEETLLQHRSSLAEEGPSSELSSRIPETSLRRPLRAITNFEHPAPELADVQREIVHYTRADGVRLNANLYLPPGHDVKRDGPLPVFLWAYPREYKSAAFAGQTRGSPYRFVRLGRTPLYWLTCGYAILDGPEMPIIGEGDVESNDTYVPQLVMSAEAAVNFLVEKGIAERNRIAVGGHSYGAFMAVNLLAHAPALFCCGIARSGAYNRTLTPFGFQSEERTLWQATEVYHAMSPYMYADRIKAPLLLIHGDADNNPGTFPMQSERLYQALKGHGRITRYVNLPHEGHGYRARESVMHALAEMTEWLDKFTKAPSEVPRASLLTQAGLPRK
jgi:predicted esterase